MRPQVSSRRVEGVVELQVQMVCLQIGDQEDGRHGAWKFPEGIEDILGLQSHALPEFLAMHLGGGTDLGRVLPRTRGVRVERPPGAELALAYRLNGAARISG